MKSTAQIVILGFNGPSRCPRTSRSWLIATLLLTRKKEETRSTRVSFFEAGGHQ
jgi:hypothetical protein